MSIILPPAYQRPSQYAVEASGVEFINGDKPDVRFTRPLQQAQKRFVAELQTRPRENDRCMTRQLARRSLRSGFIGKPGFDQRLIGNIPFVSRNLQEVSPAGVTISRLLTA
jgi:hypothetical protein